MPKPQRETIGQCPCSMRGCEQTADVRRAKDQRLYLVCPDDGVINTRGDRFQAYIEKHSVKLEPANEPGPDPAPEPDPAPKSEGPDPAPARKGIGDWFL